MYTVYKTVCLVNQKFYIGVHKTDDPNDSYLGSGKYLKHAIAKYGVENFRKEVLAVFEVADEAFALERALVTRELVESKQCYNIKLGGEGGFDFINIKGLNNRADNSTRGGHAFAERVRSDPQFRAGHQARSKRVATAMHRAGRAVVPFRDPEQQSEFRRRAQSPHARAKRRASLRDRYRDGLVNSQTGTVWITDGNESRKIHPSTIDSWIIRGWRKGRTIRRA